MVDVEGDDIVRLRDEDHRMEPITYYGTGTGVQLAVREAQTRGPVRLGVIGLGAGTMAAYGRKGDYVRFYDINPLVVDVARNEFWFLSGTKAGVGVALGDARISLEREMPQNFDVLVIDAFSSDAIPVHLLTLEAFAQYLRHLKEGGAIAVHVSNRYLDLEPVVAKAAAAMHLLGTAVRTDAAPWPFVTADGC